MKLWILSIIFVLGTGSLYAKEKGEFPSEWVLQKTTFSYPSNFEFPEEGSVELFESTLYFQNSLYFQIKNKEKKNSIYQYDLQTGTFQKKLWEKGRILGWTECKNQFLIQTKQKLYFVEPITWNVINESTVPSISPQWRDMVCANQKLYRLDNDQLQVLDMETWEVKSILPLPMKSVQRIVKHEDMEILLYSSFSGNMVKNFSIDEGNTKGEWKVKTNHRALFKLIHISSDRFLVFDPITKIYGEFYLFDDQLIPMAERLEKRSDGKAVRFSPIESNLQYQLEIQANEEIPETNIHVVLPKKDTYAQSLKEETFYSPSSFSLDETGNRTLTIPLAKMKKGESKTIKVYNGNLTRYKIHWKLDPNITLNREENESKFPNELRDDWFVKLNDLVVIEKSKELYEENLTLKKILEQTSKYTSSIPYKSGKFEPAPKVIEKNNGGCTEHSYVTMALLRGLGIPTRLIWNYLPTETSKEMSLNHKYVEVWIEGYGWIPMEPLAPPKSKPGVSHARHLVFAVLPTPTHPKILGGDRLVQFTKESFHLRKNLSLKLTILKDEKGEREEETIGLQPGQKQNRTIVSGEDLVVP
ncbi:transglutaminase-like domain-containing protein [Leptospira sp. WS39.C2]